MKYYVLKDNEVVASFAKEEDAKKFTDGTDMIIQQSKTVHQTVYGEDKEGELIGDKTSPYLLFKFSEIVEAYNPEYGDDRVCECGHTYDRHFDPYDDNAPVGCKYCSCYRFKEKKNA